MNVWIFLVLLYGLIKGTRDVLKKVALRDNSTFEVLLVYNVLALLFVIPTANDFFAIDHKYFLPIALKSLFVFLAFVFSFTGIKKLPVSVVGVLDLSRVLFATTLGVVVLHEVMGLNQILGLMLVCAGLLSLKLFAGSKTLSNQEEIKPFYVLMVLTSCVLNSFSGLMDKLLMRSGEITSSQLQFWYMLFMVIYIIFYVVVKKEHISKTALKNKWIWLLAILFVIMDKALFIANADPNSKVTVMTLIKQSGCLVTIIGGRLVFKEKNIIKKLLCATIIVIGIVISTLK